MVSVEDICSPDHQGRAHHHVAVCWGGKGARKKLAQGLEMGLGSQTAAMETSLLTFSAPQGDPWLQPVCWGELSCSSLSSKLQPDRDTWAGWGACQWRRTAAAHRRQSDCVLSLNTHATASSMWTHPSQSQWVLQAPVSFQRETRGAHGALVTDSSPGLWFPQNYLCVSNLRCCKTR